MREPGFAEAATGRDVEERQGVTRRTVLKWIGIGAGGVVVVTAGTAGVRGALNGVWSAGQGAPYELWAAWPTMTGIDAVVAAGVLAANPHNTQPWRFHIEDQVVEVSADPGRRMPVTDASDREHHAGIGCAIENMVVAARAQGLDAEVRAFPDDSAADLVARITFTTGPGPTEAELSLADAIARRHTDRGPFSSDGVAPGAIAELEATQAEGARLLSVTDPEKVRGMGELYVRATEAIIGDRDQSIEGFSWFRNDRADVERHRDGLTLDCQGLDELTLAMAKILPAQSRSGGDEFWLKSTRDVHTATAAAYGVVVVDDVLDPAAQVAGGRLLQRLHLRATELGLGFQHMNQITERIDRARASGTTDEFSEPWAEVIGIPAGRGLVSFRLGRPVRAAGPSPRRRTHDVVSVA